MEYTLQDLLALYLPYAIYPAVLLIGAAVIYDPAIPMLIYTILPESMKTWPWFWLCFIEEVRFVTFFDVLAVPLWQIQIISFDLINVNLEAVTSCTSRR